MSCNTNDILSHLIHLCLQHLDLRITTESQIAGSLDEYSTVRQHVLEEATVSKSNYDAGIEYLDRNYGSVFDGKASNGDSLKYISGIMGMSRFCISFD